MNKILTKIWDGYNNFASRLGLQTDNMTKHGTYQWDPLVNERMTLEYMYSGSWIAKAAIEMPAHDMTRVGVTLQGLPVKDNKLLQHAILDLNIWPSLCECIKWARLYGGCLGYIRIDGQDPSTPLDFSTIGVGQFQGIDPMSRWQITPSIAHMVEEGPEYGLPQFYTSVFDNSLYSKPFTIHHSRVIRFIGIEVPWFQRIALLFWGQSLLVNIRPQIQAYDSIKTMIDQLANKAHLRTLRVKGMRDLLATGGEDGEEELMKYVTAMRMTQSSEDITVIDGDDEFGAIPYNFAGLKDVMEICGEQIAAATGIPQSKLFGRQADGLGASHTGDNINYLANLESERENRLRRPIGKILDVLSMSILGKPLPEDFSFTFDSLDQMDDKEVAELGSKFTDTIIKTYQAGLITSEEARKELSELSLMTKLFDDLAADIEHITGEEDATD